MFGALWTSKEIEKKLNKEKSSLKKENDIVNVEKINNVAQIDFPIAHKRVTF